MYHGKVGQATSPLHFLLSPHIFSNFQDDHCQFQKNIFLLFTVIGVNEGSKKRTNNKDKSTNISSERRRRIPQRERETETVTETDRQRERERERKLLFLSYGCIAKLCFVSSTTISNSSTYRYSHNGTTRTLRVLQYSTTGSLASY